MNEDILCSIDLNSLNPDYEVYDISPEIIEYMKEIANTPDGCLKKFHKTPIKHHLHLRRSIARDFLKLDEGDSHRCKQTSMIVFINYQLNTYFNLGLVIK